MATAGAEFMALETTEEAGMCLAFRSMLGLVGSSVGRGRRVTGGQKAALDSSHASAAPAKTRAPSAPTLGEQHHERGGSPTWVPSPPQHPSHRPPQH